MADQIWIRKYAPKKLSEVVGQVVAVNKLKQYVESFGKKSKGIFLYGGQGTGKTSSVYALAEEGNYELIELNASDTRNTAAIQTILGGASKQMSLFGNKKLILVDELEGISGMKDRGGISAIIKIMKTSTFPIIVIAHDAHNDKVKAMRKECELIEYDVLSADKVLELLKSIAQKEKIDYDERALKQLARISGGDARAAVNDLQTITVGTNKLDMNSVKELSDRNSTQSIEEALKIVFKTTSPEIALMAYNNIAEDLDKIFLWVEENMPKEYLDPKALQKGFDNLSLADVFYGRIRRWQYYRFYVYCYNLMSAGIAISKDDKNGKDIKYKRSSKLLRIWIANNANAKRKTIASKIAQKTHTSQRKAFQSTVPFIQVIFKNNEAQADKLSKLFDLSDEEIEWLKRK